LQKVITIVKVVVVEAVRKVGIPRVLRDLTGQLKVARIDILRLRELEADSMGLRMASPDTSRGVERGVSGIG